MKVENMTNNNGNKIVNQFIIHFNNDYKIFQSYNSIIAKIDLIQSDDNEPYIFLDSYYWNYSKTTSKYRNKFLNMTTKEIENAIKNGSITLTDLNHGG